MIIASPGFWRATEVWQEVWVIRQSAPKFALAGGHARDDFSQA